MPFDLAFQLDPVTRAAYAIKFSSFHGRKFNWGAWVFEDPG